jgi:hypothetical protein
MACRIKNARSTAYKKYNETLGVTLPVPRLAEEARSVEALARLDTASREERRELIR